MAKTNLPDARKRILASATSVFAEKGFDGSRIDEIARQAGVPKSLIYYHFPGKEAILEVLIQESLAEYLQTVRQAMAEIPGECGAMVGREARYYQFATRNADLMRVLFIESLKKSNQKPALYRMAEALVDLEAGPAEERNERLVAEFFTSIIPCLAFICFEHSWPAYFGISPAAMGKLFLGAYSATHGAYHRDRTL